MNRMGGRELGRSGLGQYRVMGPCECSDEPSGFIKSGEFNDQLRNRWPFKMDSAPQNSLVT